MTADEAFGIVCARFPFESYLNTASDIYRMIAKICCQYLAPGSRILDFGSGPCDKTAIAHLLGFPCVAYDDLRESWHMAGNNREKILAFSMAMGIEFHVGDGSSLPFERESFDMVMMHHVLEHLQDSPRVLLNGLLERLKPGGYLFVTVPNAANPRKRLWLLFGRSGFPRFESFYWSPSPWRGHVREYVRHDLVQLTQYLGVEVVRLHTYLHMLRRLPASLRPSYRALTAVVPGFRDSWLLLARKPVGWQPRHSPDDGPSRAAA